MIRYKREGPCAIAADMLVAAGRDDPPTTVLIFGAGRPAVRGMVGMTGRRRRRGYGMAYLVWRSAAAAGPPVGIGTSVCASVR